MPKALKIKTKSPVKILAVGITIYTLLLTAISWYKYFHLGYNALDLAIFDNVFFNAISGNGWWSSIQGHHYFADHFAPLLALLLPFYALWSSPLNLLFWQSLLLGLSALPVYLLGRKIISQKWGAALALVWLINPLLWNINLHEWHILPLAVPLLLLAYYFYLQNNFKYFLLLLIASMLIREDVVVVTFMFSLLALLDKKEKKWIVSPAVLSILYFIFTMWLIAALRPGGSRFMMYYQWIFDSSPLQIIAHLFSLGNIEMIIGLLLAFLFVPLLAGRYLILALGVFLQIALVAGGGSNIITDTHYSSLFLPALIISSLWGIKKIKNKKTKLTKLLSFDPALSKAIISVSLIYLLATLGPGYGIAKEIIKPEKNKTNIKKLNLKIPDQAIIASSYVYLPIFSTRQKIYPLHYLLIGYQQFSLEPFPYKLPDYFILDLEDLLSFELQLKNAYYFSNFYPQGFNNLKNILSQGYKLKYFNHQFAVWQKNKNWQNKYFEPEIKLNSTTTPAFRAKSIALQSYKVESGLLIAKWRALKPIADNLFIRLTTPPISYLRPPSLFTPTSLWRTNKIYQSIIFIPPQTKKITIEVGTIEGQLELNNWRGTTPNYKFKPISPSWTLNLSPDKQ